jgi:mono/diheme cytochrome c family protein
MQTNAVVVLVLLGLLAVAALAGEQHGDPVAGKRLFLQDGCYQCHGTTGAGGGIAGPKLAPNPLPPEVITAKLRTASGRMPVYTAAVLTDAQVADIVAYLQSIPSGIPSENIPLLNH